MDGFTYITTVFMDRRTGWLLCKNNEGDRIKFKNFMDSFTYITTVLMDRRTGLLLCKNEGAQNKI